MTTEPFTRTTSRSFVVAPDFPVIVALCCEEGQQALLRDHYKSERDAGRIVLTLSEKFSPEINTNHIALADELFIINPSGQYTDFTAAMFVTAQKLDKHIRCLKP